MRIYIEKILWYVGLLLIMIGALLMPIPNNPIIGPLMSAIVLYIPLSLTWIPISYLMTRYYGHQEKFIGLDLHTLCVCILFLGIICCASFLYLRIADILEFGILMFCCGGEGIISLREEKAKKQSLSLHSRKIT